MKSVFSTLVIASFFIGTLAHANAFCNARKGGRLTDGTSRMSDKSPSQKKPIDRKAQAATQGQS